MGLKRTDEFRKDAVRITLTSGLTRKRALGMELNRDRSSNVRRRRRFALRDHRAGSSSLARRTYCSGALLGRSCRAWLT